MQDFRHLKKEIEKLLSKGYPSDHVGNNNKRMEHQLQREVLRLPIPPGNRIEWRNEDNVRTIHLIHGGLGLNGAFNNARKRYAREMHGALCVYNLRGSVWGSLCL